MAETPTRSRASACTLPSGPLEIPQLHLGPCDSVASVIKACLDSPYASAISFRHLPPVVMVDRPLEIEFSALGTCPSSCGDASVSRCISHCANLVVSIESKGQTLTQSAAIAARPFDGGWIGRALIHPAAWADATSITVVNISFAGRSYPCDFLPTTLRIGYCHAPAPAGAVLTSAKDGNVDALKAALEAGGSTEEADDVRSSWRLTGMDVML